MNFKMNAALIVASSILLYAFLVYFDAFEIIVKWSRQYEKYEIDELFLLIPVFVFLLSLISIHEYKQVRQKNNELSHVMSEHQKTSKELIRSEKMYRDLFDEAPIMYLITENQDGVPIIKDTNNKFLETMGYQREEIIGKPITDYYSSESVYGLLDRDKSQRDLSGGFVESERSFVTSTGQIINTLVSATMVLDKSTKHILVRSAFLDITQRKKVELEKESLKNQLFHAQKMESIGVLAGGIAHDFNNILSAIIGYTELTFDAVPENSFVKDNMNAIYTAGLRAKDLVGQILSFARQSEEETKPIQVDIIIKEALKLLRASIPTSIKIKHNINSDSLIIGNHTHVHQIIMNLCTNAAHAMKDEGGIIEVTLLDITIDEAKRRKNPDLKFSDYIELKVSDTGTGISPGIVKSIYEPYFSTKNHTEGTGLGLAVVHGIIESYDGEIYVSTALGKGTTFTVYLPITKKRKPSTPYKSEKLPSGTERILIVDDEAQIAQMSRKILERLGYKVAIRTSSLEALELFQAKPDDFDLILTDMTMPNLTGDKLSIELMKIRPDIPIILCTGYSNKISDETVPDIGIKAFAYKPIVKADLASTVRKVLDDAMA